MRKLTSILCLTIAMLLGSVDVSRSADFQKEVAVFEKGNNATLGDQVPIFGSPILAVAVSSDASQLAVALNDTIFVFSLHDNVSIKILKGDKHKVAFLKFSHDGKFLASGGGQLVIIWSVIDGRALTQLKHNEMFSAAAFSPDNSYIVTGTWDGDLIRWGLPEGKRTDTLKAHMFGYVNMDFPLEGDTLVTAGMDQTIRLWDTSKLIQKRFFKQGGIGIKAARAIIKNVGIINQGRWMLSLTQQDVSFDGRTQLNGKKGVLALWDMVDGTLLKVSSGIEVFKSGRSLTVGGSKVAFLPVGSLELNKPKSIVLFDYLKWTIQSELKSPFIDEFTDIALLADGQILFGAGVNGLLCIWDVNKLEILNYISIFPETVYYADKQGKIIAKFDVN